MARKRHSDEDILKSLREIEVGLASGPHSGIRRLRKSEE